MTTHLLFGNSHTPATPVEYLHISPSACFSVVLSLHVGLLLLLLFKFLGVLFHFLYIMPKGWEYAYPFDENLIELAHGKLGMAFAAPL